MRNCIKRCSIRKIKNHWNRIITFSLVSLFSRQPIVNNQYNKRNA